MQARLLIDKPASGSRNMAVDEALLASAAAAPMPTLRLYTWSPATLSLGYFQSAAERERHRASQSCAVVRRASGGGAILHDRELTYSLTLPCANRFSQQAADIYRNVHRSLIETFATWEIAAALFAEQAVVSLTANDQAAEPFLCFQRRSSEDIIVRDSKIVGSAQRRNHGALLQHGSILLDRSAFAPELPGLNDVAEHLPTPITSDELTQRWLPRLAAALSWELQPGQLTDTEQQAAREWETQRFATEEWTGKR